MRCNLFTPVYHLGEVPAFPHSAASASMARPHPPCNRMAQVQHVHIGDNVKYYPIIATDKQVAFKYFTTLKKGYWKNTVQKPKKFTLCTVHTKILAWVAVVTKCTSSMEPVTSFHRPPKKRLQAFTFGGSLALDSPQRMPLSLLSLSELELSKYSLAYSLPVLSRGRYHGE